MRWVLDERIPNPAIGKGWQRQLKRFCSKQVLAQEGIELLKTVVVARNNSGNLLQTIAELEPE